MSDDTLKTDNHLSQSLQELRQNPSFYHFYKINILVKSFMFNCSYTVYCYKYRVSQKSQDIIMFFLRKGGNGISEYPSKRRRGLCFRLCPEHGRHQKFIEASPTLQRIDHCGSSATPYWKGRAVRVNNLSWLASSWCPCLSSPQTTWPPSLTMQSHVVVPLVNSPSTPPWPSSWKLPYSIKGTFFQRYPHTHTVLAGVFR